MVGGTHGVGRRQRCQRPPAAGFLSRIPTGSMAINSLLGYVMIALAVPAALALFAFVRAQAGWQQWIGPAVLHRLHRAR